MVRAGCRRSLVAKDAAEDGTTYEGGWWEPEAIVLAVATAPLAITAMTVVVAVIAAAFEPVSAVIAVVTPALGLDHI
jgi:hypothetical protein